MLRVIRVQSRSRKTPSPFRPPAPPRIVTTMTARDASPLRTEATRAEQASNVPLLYSLDSYEAAARAILPRAVYDYYAGGAEDEVTLRWNRIAYERYHLRPRVMVDVSRVDPGVELLGERLAFPVALAPAAFQRLAHPDGELATARAARAAGTIFITSTLSTYSVDDIAV